MGFWRNITNGIKNATKLLQGDDTNVTDSTVTDSAVETTTPTTPLQEGQAILDNNKKTGSVLPEIDTPKVELNKPIPQVTPVTGDVKEPNVEPKVESLEPKVEPKREDTWLEEKLMMIPDFVNKEAAKEETKGQSIEDIMGRGLDWFDTKLKSLKGKADINKEGIIDLGKIDGIDTLGFHGGIKTTYKDIAGYDKDMAELNYNAESDIKKFKTQDEINNYMLNTYIPAVDAANIKHFKNYTKEGKGITQEQLSSMRDVTSRYFDDVSNLQFRLYPKKVLEQERFERLTKEVAQQSTYIDVYKSRGGEMSSDPFVIMKANKINQLVAQELMQLENIPNLSSVEIEQAKQEVIALRTVGVTALAMQDTNATKEEVDAYLKENGYDKRNIFTKDKSNIFKGALGILTSMGMNSADFLGDTETEVEKIYNKYDQISLDRFKIDSVWDLQNFVSKKAGVFYGSRIEPWFDVLRNAEKGSLAEYGMYDLDAITTWTDTYQWNKTVDNIKKGAEIGAVTAATILSEGALSGIGSSAAVRMGASKAWQVALTEGLSSVFIKGSIQNAFVEGALKANFPTMEITNQDAQLNVIFDTFGALFDAANAAQKMHAIDMGFIRTTESLPGVNILAKDLDLSFKEKTAIVNGRPVIERTVRAFNKANPELASQMVKDAILKKQLYKYIKKEIVPKWEGLLTKHGGDKEKAYKEFAKIQDQGIKTRLGKYNKVVDTNVSALEFMSADSTIINSAHDAPKLSDITKGKSKMVGDSVEDLINYYIPTRPNQTTKTSLFNLLNLSPADNADTVIAKVKTTLDTDPEGADTVLKVITHTDANGIPVYFDNGKQNSKFDVLARNVGTDFNVTYNGLALNDYGIALRNATNNGIEMVGELSYDKIQYRKATDEEKANPNIPKFKIDSDMLVPTKPATTDMVKGKRINGRHNNMQVTSDNVTTLDVDGKSYVENPIKLNTEVKGESKHSKRVSPQDAQGLYLDYISKVSKKADDITYIDDNDLYIKLYDSIDNKDALYSHAKTSEVLDYVMNQNDTTQLLEVIDGSNGTSLKRFVNYLSSNDDATRAAYVIDYDGPHKELVSNTAIEDKVGENIATKNLMAEILVKNGSFNNKSMAYKYVNDNYSQLVTYAVKNNDESGKEYLMSTLPSSTMKLVKTEGHITNPLGEFFMYNNFPKDIIDQINKLTDEYDIIRRFDMAKDEAGYIDHNLMEIAINGMFLKESDIFAHEFGHRLNHLFTDNTNKIINKLYLKDQDKAINALMKKYKGMDRAGAMSHLSDSKIYTDPKHFWYIGPDHYQAMNQSERVAENVKKYLTGGAKSIPKEARSILKQLFDWLEELYKKILGVKKTHDEFVTIMNNLSDHIDEKVAKLPSTDIEYMRSNINFYNKDGTTIFENKITNALDTSLAEELESGILEYIADNGGLELEFLNSVEGIIDMRSKVGTREYNAAKSVLHKYFNSYYNNNNRSLVDMADSLTDFSKVTKDAVDVTHEFLLSTRKFKDLVRKNGFEDSAFNQKIKSIIEDAAKKYSKNTYISDMTRKSLDAAINDALNKFDLYLLQEAKKAWTVSPEKINKVLDVVANTNFSVPGKIYSFNFIPEESWNTPVASKIFTDAYKSKELILPLPGEVNHVDKRVKDFFDNKDKIKGPIQRKIEFIIDSVPKEGKSYVFADHDTIKHRDSFIKDFDNVPDITLVKSEMNMISMRLEGDTLRLGSYNNNAFDGLKETIQSIMPVKKDVFVSDSVKEMSKEIGFSDTISEYFNDVGLVELPDSTYKYMNQDPNYLINLVNSRKAVINKYSDYQFIDMNVIAKDLENRRVITPAVEVTVDDILDSVTPAEYQISRGFLETINTNYGLELQDANKFSAEKLELVRRLMTRSYVSQNHADMMMAQLKLLKMFMVQSDANKLKYSEMITPLFHRNIMNGVDLNNRAIRGTVKNLVYNDLMESGLPDAISSYVMRADEVFDYLIDNAADVESLSKDLMTYERSVGDVRPLAEVTLPGQLSVYLENFYDRNRKELIDWFNKKTGRNESTIKPERDPETNDIVVGDNIFERSTTAKKGLGLMFLNDTLLNVVDDVDRIKTATNFHLYEPLSRGRYLKDNNINSYINGMGDIALEGVIKKENFNKVLKVSDAEMSDYIKGTVKLLNTTKGELISFYKSSIDAWENISGKTYAPYFFKKEQIDNLFGEVYVKTRNYVGFLENNFGGTKALNTVISDIKKNTYSLDKFSRVTPETLELYKISINKIMDAIKVGQDNIIKELETMSGNFDMSRLIRSGETGKLSIGEGTDGSKLLITDGYKLNDFLKTEAEYLGYNAPAGFFDDDSTSIQQMKLVGMYSDGLQKIIDSQAVGYLDKAKIGEFFFRNSSVKNPFRWKEPIFLGEDSRINSYARNFWNSNHVPKFNVYTLLNKETDMPTSMFRFFKSQGLEFDHIDNVVNALDLTIKNNLTYLSEGYIRSKKYIGRNWNKDMKHLIVESLFKGLYDLFDKNFLRTFSKNINGENKFIVEYVDSALAHMEIIKSSRINNKVLKTSEMLNYLQKNNSKFKYLSKRLLSVVDALKPFAGNEAYKALDSANMGLNVRGHQISMINAITNKADKALLMQQLAKANNDLAEQTMLARMEYDLDTFGKSKEELNDAQQDMVDIEQKAFDEIYGSSKTDKMEGRDPMQFAKDAKKKLYDSVSLDNRMKYIDAGKYLDSILNNKEGVGKYVSSDGTVGGTSNLKSPYYEPNTDQEFIKGIIEENNEAFHSIKHPDFAKEEAKIMEQSIQAFDDMIADTKSLFTNCINL